MYSNYTLYIYFRFFPMAGFALFLMIVPFAEDSFALMSLFVAVTLMIAILAIKYVTQAVVTREEIIVRDDISLRWVDIKSLVRIRHLYILRTMRGQWFLFPTSRRYSLLLGVYAKDDPMNQLIEKMRDVHGF
jgi:hypothetical protein